MERSIDACALIHV
jgi:hypothetical protein